MKMAGWNVSIRPFALVFRNELFDIVKPVVIAAVIECDEIAISEFAINEFRMSQFPRHRIKLLYSADGVIFDPTNFYGFRIAIRDRLLEGFERVRRSKMFTKNFADDPICAVLNSYAGEFRHEIVYVELDVMCS